MTSFIIGVIDAFILIIILLFVRIDQITDPVRIVFLAIQLIAFVGILIGIQSYSRNDIWYHAFRPTRKNISLTFLISGSFLLIFSIITLRSITQPLLPVTLYTLFTLVSYFVMFTIYIFPFSALSLYLYNRWKHIDLRRHLISIIILIIILNPLFIYISIHINILYGDLITMEPCGVQITGFNQPSPAEEAGLEVNDTIHMIDNEEIETIGDIQSFMDSYEPSHELTIQSSSGIRTIIPAKKRGQVCLRNQYYPETL